MKELYEKCFDPNVPLDERWKALAYFMQMMREVRG